MHQSVLRLIILLTTLASGDALAQNYVTIPAGTFTMGCVQGDPICDYNSFEQQHTVTISRNFALMEFEVTQLDWVLVMGTNPSLYKGPMHCPGSHIIVNGVNVCPYHPVEGGKWVDVDAYIDALNAAQSLTCSKTPSDPAGCYRLPTNAEWEYAARAGTTTHWSWGSNPVDANDYAWYSGNSGGVYHIGGGKFPNAFGLHDMHGNVAEYVSDWRSNSPLPNATDPTGPTTGSTKVIRGGQKASSTDFLTSYNQDHKNPIIPGALTGFRLARNL